MRARERDGGTLSEPEFQELMTWANGVKFDQMWLEFILTGTGYIVEFRKGSPALQLTKHAVTSPMVEHHRSNRRKPTVQTTRTNDPVSQAGCAGRITHQRDGKSPTTAIDRKIQDPEHRQPLSASWRNAIPTIRSFNYSVGWLKLTRRRRSALRRFGPKS